MSRTEASRLDLGDLVGHAPPLFGDFEKGRAVLGDEGFAGDALYLGGSLKIAFGIGHNGTA